MSFFDQYNELKTSKLKYSKLNSNSDSESESDSNSESISSSNSDSESSDNGNNLHRSEGLIKRSINTINEIGNKFEEFETIENVKDFENLENNENNEKTGEIDLNDLIEMSDLNSNFKIDTVIKKHIYTNGNQLKMKSELDEMDESDKKENVKEKKKFNVVYMLWNRIPYIRHIVSFILICLQILSFVFLPGWLNFVNICFFFIESIMLMFLWNTIFRKISYLRTTIPK